ncbi:MAG: hypothetical protein ABMA00_12795 [Gemmatimonas sp.]
MTVARGLALLGASLLVACAQIGSEPDVPTAIEMPALPSPSVVIGDTLRNVDGVVTPVKAIVRNLQGDIIVDAPVRYLYADFQRDSALAIDSSTGIVRALKASTGDARLGARIGTSLQVLRIIVVTTRPDSADRVGQSALGLFTTTLADTGRTGANANRSPALTMVVRHVDSPTVTTPVNGWPVRFEVLSPANATNDTTKSVYLVDEQGRASVFDTTDASGVAGRRVRVRAALFPTSAAIDSVIVRAIVTYKGISLKGAPVRIALGVQRGT